MAQQGTAQLHPINCLSHSKINGTRYRSGRRRAPPSQPTANFSSLVPDFLCVLFYSLVCFFAGCSPGCRLRLPPIRRGAFPKFGPWILQVLCRKIWKRRPLPRPRMLDLSRAPTELPIFLREEMPMGGGRLPLLCVTATTTRTVRCGSFIFPNIPALFSMSVGWWASIAPWLEMAGVARRGSR